MRRHRRRRSLFKLKLKKETVYTLFSILLGVFFIGMVVFFNTSIDRIFLTPLEVMGKIKDSLKKSFFAPFFAKKGKPLIVQERALLKIKESGVGIAVKPSSKLSSGIPDLGTTVVAN